MAAHGKDDDAPVRFSREKDRLRFFIQSIATMKLSAPNGVRSDAYHAKLLRELRNAAKLILEQTP